MIASGATLGKETVTTQPSAMYSKVDMASDCVSRKLAHLPLLASVDRIGGGPASLIGTPEPLVLVLMTTVCLGEHLAPSRALGGALILVSLILARWWSQSVDT